ncbi:hypothetical protein BJ138DRAFT_769532 [Hygrophoropsis aurantiaca]|uniref:Uncharacterized protein n=1 Tax=Hygrophoropsis aurantiaca TaxID=72124 RepID=A0ACB8AGU9_9AGAM|nr:hypothetical protein BJ138DRAFT_769532 [Hygrophoropsis aurantiaca]
MSKVPLPSGWRQEYDLDQDHPYWVDTTANPPRAIWVHPYEDEQFLSEHPEIRKKIEKLGSASLDEPPPYERARRHSFSGGEPSTSARKNSLAPSLHNPGTPLTDDSHEQRKRGMFGKLKDKAIGTKEEREAHKKQKQEARVREEEEYQRKRMENLRARQEYLQRGSHGYPGYGSAPMYGPPVGSPYGYGGYSQSGYGGRGVGMGGMGMGLLGGLAGGLLLGDVLDGGFGGGGFGGGFDGGFGGGGGFF